MHMQMGNMSMSMEPMAPMQPMQPIAPMQGQQQSSQWSASSSSSSTGVGLSSQTVNGQNLVQITCADPASLQLFINGRPVKFAFA